MSSVSTSADPPSESSSVAVGVVRTRAEAAAAAPPPPPTQSPERAAGEVEIVGAGGSGADVPVITAAAVYNRDGEPHAVNTAVVKAVDDFKVPEGYVRKGSREKSYMYSLGVYIEALKGDKHQFYCLVDRTCRRKNKMIPCKGGDRSNVNSHLKNAHGLQGLGGVVKEGKKKAAKENIAANLAAKENSGVGTDRVRELLAVKMVVEKFLPFSFFSSGTTWRDLAGMLTAQATPFPALSSRRVKHLLVEMYVATKQAVVGNMQEEINKAPLPIIHYGLDLWTCKVSGRKYLGVHVFYVDSNFSLRHALISVKHYAPSTEIQGTEKASEILFTIFRATLAEYGIKLSDLAGGTTDSGSDVKAMCVNILLGLHKIWWDWCDCHLADKSAENAFGTSADPQKSKNKIARDVIKLVIKTAAKINQSTIVKQKFEKVTLEMLDEILKITKHAPQRWLSLVLVMERIIRLWHVLRKVYANDGEEFPLDKGNNRDDILQLYSLLQPLSAITRDGQYGNAPMTAEMHLAFAQLKMEVLDPEQPLRVFDIPPAPNSPEAENEHEVGTGRKGGKPKLPSRMIPASELRPVTVKTRKELSKALVERLFGRVWDEDSADPSPFRDAAVLLTPPFNTGKYLEALRLSAADAEYLSIGKKGLAPTMDSEVTAKLDSCWADIKRRAWEAARERNRRSESLDDGVQPLHKRFRGESSTSSATRKSRFSLFGRGDARSSTDDMEDEDSEDRKLGEVVAGELEHYKSLFIKADELDCREVLPWWKRTGKNIFPHLAPVAQQVFGNQAAVSQVERDFSGVGILLAPNRSRMDTYWVEIVMFLNANFAHIPPLKQIPMVAAKNIRSCLPARFHGRDADLMAAEAIFDVLMNTAPPSVNDIDL